MDYGGRFYSLTLLFIYYHHHFPRRQPNRTVICYCWAEPNLNFNSVNSSSCHTSYGVLPIRLKCTFINWKHILKFRILPNPDVCARCQRVFFCVSLLSFRWHPQRNRAFRGRGENNHICPFINHAAVFLRVCVCTCETPHALKGIMHLKQAPIACHCW